MTFREIKGDLFDPAHGFDAIGHGVNCIGAMGAGIAVPFKALDGNMYDCYRYACLNGDLLPGEILPWRLDDGTWVYNLATQHDPGPNAVYVYVAFALSRMIAHAEQNGILSIGLPRIGCGIGGLEWGPVSTLMKLAADRSEVELVAVSP